MPRFLNAVLFGLLLTSVAFEDDSAEEEEMDTESWTPYGNEAAPEDEVQHIITPVFKENEYDFFGDEGHKPIVVRFGVPGLMLSAASYVTVAVMKVSAREGGGLEVPEEREARWTEGIKNYDV